MPLPSWCNDTITVTRAPWATERGTKVRDWARAQDHAIGGCSVQYTATASLDRAQRAQAVATSAVVYCPPGADVEAGDRIQHGGATFEVEGSPIEVKSPFGGCDHILVNITARRG